VAIMNRQTEIARKLAAELALPPAQRSRAALAMRDAPPPATSGASEEARSRGERRVGPSPVEGFDRAEGAVEPARSLWTALFKLTVTSTVAYVGAGLFREGGIRCSLKPSPLSRGTNANRR
jgi:hypothetical protein